MRRRHAERPRRFFFQTHNGVVRTVMDAYPMAWRAGLEEEIGSIRGMESHTSISNKMKG
jgi:hypothetical protein